jgi:CO/xanthine dehydrogenase Mo-binding subunit
MRMRNVIVKATLRGGFAAPQGISIEKVIRACAEKAGWRKQKTAGNARRRMLTGTSDWVSRRASSASDPAGYLLGNRGDARRGNHRQSRSALRRRGHGQGAQSVYAQFTASALRIPLENVEVINATPIKPGRRQRLRFAPDLHVR